MNLGKLAKYKSWLTSAGIALAIAVWLMSGQMGDDDVVVASEAGQVADSEIRTSVRIRTQSAEEVTRTINVNGKTAPARIVEINAETIGRVVSVGVERGNRMDQGEIIVRLDERDRHARLSQAHPSMALCRIVWLKSVTT